MPQLHLAPPQDTLDAIRKLAAQEGISVNAYITPFLNHIARGELTRSAHYLPPSQQVKKVA